MDARTGSGLRDGIAGVAARAVAIAGAGRRVARRGGEATAKSGQWAYAALASCEPPRVPAGELWELSLGTLVGGHPRTPGVVRRALRLLDRFGAVAVGPDRVGFDADDVLWDRVLEVRTSKAFEMLTAQALDREVDRLREMLPPLPGRTWLVTRATEVLATVVLAALEQGSADELGELTVPSEIVHRGLLGRRRTLSGGLFAVAVLTVVEQAGPSLLATAEQHGVPVTGAAPPAADDDRSARTAALRERTAAVSRRLRAFQEAADQEDEEDAGGTPGEPVPTLEGAGPAAVEARPADGAPAGDASPAAEAARHGAVPPARAD